MGQVLVRCKGHVLAVVEKLLNISCRFRRGNDQVRVVRAVGQARPAVRPLDFLQGGFAPQCAVSTLRQGAGADVGDVPLAADLDKTGVTALLQRVGGIVPRGQQREIGRILPRAVQRSGARDRGGVMVARAVRRAEQVIIPILFQNLRPLADAQRCAAVKVFARTHQLPCDGVKLLNDGTRKAGVFQPPVKQHIQEIVVSVVIMEQRRVKAAGSHQSRSAPRTGNFWRSDDIVQRVLKGGRAFDIGINQPEQPVRVGEMRCPQAAGIVVAQQLTGNHIAPGDGRSHPLPVDKIL